jgi:hypothetical protein
MANAVAIPPANMAGTATQLELQPRASPLNPCPLVHLKWREAARPEHSTFFFRKRAMRILLYEYVVDRAG